MKVIALAENTSVSQEFGSEHGLSLYIETQKHKLLFDTGKSRLFLENAQKIGIDLSQVDTAFISHGHYDHGGGLYAFLEVNPKASVYLHEQAFGDYYSKRSDATEYIGLNKGLQGNPRLILTKGFLKIDDELSVFSDVYGRELPSLSNKTLLIKEKNGFREDPFEHEQNLVICENGKKVLFAGCAHNGIVNIMQRVFEITERYADAVIGGFHLHNPSSRKTEAPELICAIAERLKKTGSHYYTCHCTGATAYRQLKDALGEQIEYLATSGVVVI
ncbi:MAG: MBL fold metallo-hydrolase [Clostridiales bacterium]|jgi:7,8-dihydropterin-6-yl-methyl-4-(beta-D-ribofuranosyl)aminobenzene 5'-phosphate synthase|nr:MBL fold metallo-hydrolase [Clostridiales bacterium]